ncbi:MAG: hypothetical protein R3A12_12010 [Ignavibacteria bacterium]
MICSGFGIVIPLLPSFSFNELGIGDLMIGFYCRNIFSDAVLILSRLGIAVRYGRKPILIMSLSGKFPFHFFMLALVFSGIIKSMTLLIVARAFAGVFAANISAGLAAISDVTSSKDRTKGIRSYQRCIFHWALFLVRQ